jgi:hypothetical protein
MLFPVDFFNGELGFAKAEFPSFKQFFTDTSFLDVLHGLVAPTLAAGEYNHMQQLLECPIVSVRVYAGSASDLRKITITQACN